ncbi:hypothetical protein [Amycolatopsis taiwanensis]|uniref:hypothetical protein n=1 Tax=Amycolatopsis taiwanensis TaxID=342230 RepID=UPI0012EB2F4C|nr:hypothetical protein [Amycolatopsis taiwanensis]
MPEQLAGVGIRGVAESPYFEVDVRGTPALAPICTNDEIQRHRGKQRPSAPAQRTHDSPQIHGGIQAGR